jgi:hypothetical protein
MLKLNGTTNAEEQGESVESSNRLATMHSVFAQIDKSCFPSLVDFCPNNNFRMCIVQVNVSAFEL